MKRKKSEVDERRELLLTMIRTLGNDRFDVESVAEKLSVSAVTLRRDLVALQDEGVISRAYGKVSLISGSRQTDVHHLDAVRDRIAEQAASMVEDGDTIFLNTSSTALRMISYIRATNVTIITDNVNAVFSEHSAGINIILTGGEVRYPKHALVGDFAIHSLQPVFAKKSFMGCSGLTPDGGMTTENANEVSINMLMINQVTGPVVVLADHNKIGVNSSFQSAPAAKITHLITDRASNTETLDAFRELGISVLTV